LYDRFDRQSNRSSNIRADRALAVGARHSGARIDPALDCVPASAQVQAGERRWDLMICSVAGANFPASWDELLDRATDSAPLAPVLADRFEV
jgi:hypothetical protein